MSTTPRPPSSRARWAVLVAVLLGVTGLAVGAVPTPAGAVITGHGVSDTTPSDPDTITVVGNLSAGDTLSIAECNVSLGIVPGTACNATDTDRYFHDAESGDFSIDIVVDGTFDNFNFIPGFPNPPGGTTTCLGSTGSQCAVVIVEYSGTTPVDTEIIPITF